MTIPFWTDIWWWWLLAILASFALIELTSIAIRWIRFGRQAAMSWTLSSTIVRWSKAHHWLPFVVTAACIILLIHWFIL